MCGICGVLFKKHNGSQVGPVMLKLISNLSHRGEDSCGIAVYGAPQKGSDGLNLLKLEVRYENGSSLDAAVKNIADVFSAMGGEVVSSRKMGTQIYVTAAYQGPITELCYALNEQYVPTISLGKSVRIFKDLDTGKELEELYGISQLTGTHAIGHTRLATESMVSRDRAHPFWAYGFEDIAIVHNGQLTNYYKLRRKFETLDYRFRTDNDSELVVVYVAHYLREGLTLHDVLERSLDDLDGTYTFLVSTPDSIGFAKDKLAAKPLVYLDLEDSVILASEEVALRAIVSDTSYSVEEPPPLTVGTWSTDGGSTFNKILYHAEGLE